jgi:hypothetical protein
MSQPNERPTAGEWTRERAVIAVVMGGVGAMVGVVVMEHLRQAGSHLAELATASSLDLVASRPRDRVVASRFTLVELRRLLGEQPEVARQVAGLYQEYRTWTSPRLLVEVSHGAAPALMAFRKRRLGSRAVTIGPELPNVESLVWDDVVGVLRREKDERRFRVAPGVELASPFQSAVVRELSLLVRRVLGAPPEPVLVAGALALYGYDRYPPLMVA